MSGDSDVELQGFVPFAKIPEALLHDTAVTDASIRVYGVLMRLAGTKAEAWPGYVYLGQLLGKSTDSIGRAMANLSDAGWVTIRRRYLNGLRRSNAYVVHATKQTEPRKDAVSDTPQECGEGPCTDAVADRESLEIDIEPLKDTARASSTEIAKTSTTPPKTAAGVEFAYFWEHYPRKIAKPKAMLEYVRALRTTSARAILDGLDLWVPYWAARSEPEFIPHPATWLHQERWNDQPPPPSNGHRNGRSNGAALERAFAREDAERAGALNIFETTAMEMPR